MYRSTLKKTLLLSTGVLLMGSGWSAPSLAQQVAIEEIIVTARQRSESLQDVPASITAFTAVQLERAGVQRVEDFINLTPGVTIVDTAEVGDTQVNIRGINGARDAGEQLCLDHRRDFAHQSGSLEPRIHEPATNRNSERPPGRHLRP